MDITAPDLAGPELDNGGFGAMAATIADKNRAWFDTTEIKVEGHVPPDCPHGILRRDSVDDEDFVFTFICERCGVYFTARID